MTALAGDLRDYQEQVGMGEAVRRAFANYANFEGRANRGEYWWYALALMLLSLVTMVLDAVLFGTPMGQYGILTIVLLLGTFIPNLAIGVRRLHDIDRSGWWILIALIPIVGTIILIVWYATRGTPGPNSFG